MPCPSCHTMIKQYDKYYNSNGIVNQFLCKTTGICSHCLLNQNLSHLLEWDRDTFDVPLITVVTNHAPNSTNNLYTKDWK